MRYYFEQRDTSVWSSLRPLRDLCALCVKELTSLPARLILMFQLTSGNQCTVSGTSAGTASVTMYPVGFVRLM
jgi:hypothetical protein